MLCAEIVFDVTEHSCSLTNYCSARKLFATLHSYPLTMRSVDIVVALKYKIVRKLIYLDVVRSAAQKVIGVARVSANLTVQTYTTVRDR